jgi:diadenosine tetraphosphate (Ap4A) HIT family hydrolase
MGFICDKHQGKTALPPGGYIWQDRQWLVGHAPAHMGRLGTLVVEARRHFLDFADMQPEEQTSYGPLLHRLYTALKQVMGAKRIYTLVLLEEQPHFHAWLVPRLPTDQTRSIAQLATDEQCSEEEAAQASAKLRALLSPQQTKTNL